MANERLPIKIVLPQSTDFYVPDAGGGPKKVFGDVTSEVRDSIAEQIEGVEKKFADSFKKHPGVPAVAVVRLKKDALAKSHRPGSLLNDQTCPVIGVDQFGELLTSVQPHGLGELKKKVLKDKTKASVANISTIDQIVPYSLAEESVRSLVLKVESGLQKIKLRLFSHPFTNADANLLRDLLDQLHQLRLPEPELMDYGKGLRILKILDPTPEAVLSLASFIGTQKLTEFAAFRTVRQIEVSRETADHAAFAAPDPSSGYPVVGLIDSGTDPNDPILGPWCEDRFRYVLDENLDYTHGSFVAGMVTFPRELHGGDQRFPSVQSKFIDIVALPKEDDHGQSTFTEDDAMDVIGESLARYTQPRVWNLSFGTSDTVTDTAFSEFASWLDEMQDQHDITFVFSAGNYRQPPLRSWPPTAAAAALGDLDRICGPAESVRGVTVGSIAHQIGNNACAGIGDPSPFTRRGPGPAFLPKPEVVHYGGNCTAQGQFAGMGVYSFDGRGNIAESIGTSFSAPIVASQLAHIHHEVKSGASRNLGKALLVHSAVLGSDHLESKELRYRGFGVPSDVISILTCAPWAATLIFEGELHQIHEFEKRQFPIPDCLRTDEGKVRGDFAMTLVYDPPLDPAWGAEYCRSNLDVSLGTYDPDKNGERKHVKKIPEESGDYKERYERFLIENGLKWSPVKVYRKYFKKGIQGDEWRMVMTLQHRANFRPEGPQRFALVVSMYDRNKTLPVYDQVVRAMALQGWQTLDLELRQDVRLLP